MLHTCIKAAWWAMAARVEIAFLGNLLMYLAYCMVRDSVTPVSSSSPKLFCL